MASLRLFIAVRCPQAVVVAVAAWQAELRAEPGVGAAFRWVAPSAFHLTLRFLGEMEENRAGSAEAAVRAAVAGRPGFSVSLQGGGAFPRPSAARVIWAGVANPRDGLADLAAAVEDACDAQDLGRADRPFSPHLTVARARAAGSPADVADALGRAAGREFGTWGVGEVELIHSTLTPAGPIYRTRLTGSLAER